MYRAEAKSKITLFFPPVVMQNAAMTKYTANLLTGADTTLEKGTKG